jgi:Lipoprotein amino terminal region
VKDNLLNILEDKNEEAEIRIAAYQGVMRCACSHSLLRIQTVLNAEEINQGRIGCFSLAEECF